MNKLTENFNLEEFRCRDGTIPPSRWMGNIIELATMLQIIRNKIKRKIYIISGYRTEKYNRRVNGSPKSQHMQGKAADIRAEGMKPEELAWIIDVMITKGEIKEGGLGRYKHFVHYDIRGNKARWNN